MAGGVAARAGVGLYLHVPFCAHRCSYCTFVSSTELERMAEVVHATAMEIRRFRHRRRLVTLYLGGGTPSLVPPELLAELFRAVRDSFCLHPRAEVTLEANPEDVTPERVAHWRALGVTRLSLGLQSLNPRTLALLERRHDAAAGRRAVRACLAEGVAVSADVMLGLPGSTPAIVTAEVEELAAAGLQHMSLYLLEMDKPHRLATLAREHPDLLPCDDEVAEAYLAASRVLRRAGFAHYEISNFARPGFACRHNLRTWRQRPLLAAGVAAHGHSGRVRWGNLERVDDYLDAVARGVSPRAWRRVLSPDEMEREAVMLALRLAAGADEGRVERCAWRLPSFARRLEDFLALGLARRSRGRVRLTPRGWLVSSELLQALW